MGYGVSLIVLDILPPELETHIFFAPLAIGLCLGICQWFALRRYISHSGWWIPTTAFGWTVGTLIYGYILWALAKTAQKTVISMVTDDWGWSFGVYHAVRLAMAALFAGLAQYLIFRRQFSMMLVWPMVCGIAYGVSKAVLNPDLNFEPFAAPFVGLLAGALTGAVLVCLLRKPLKPSD